MQLKGMIIGRGMDCGKMSGKDLVIFVLLLSCLLALQQVLQATMVEYTCLYNQKWRFLVQLMNTIY